MFYEYAQNIIYARTDAKIDGFLLKKLGFGRF